MPGKRSVMTWTYAASGARSVDAFAEILRHTSRSLKPPYSSAVCHLSFFCFFPLSRDAA
jgi:hypothetical protein